MSPFPPPLSSTDGSGRTLDARSPEWWFFFPPLYRQYCPPTSCASSRTSLGLYGNFPSSEAASSCPPASRLNDRFMIHTAHVVTVSVAPRDHLAFFLFDFFRDFQDYSIPGEIPAFPPSSSGPASEPFQSQALAHFRLDPSSPSRAERCFFIRSRGPLARSTAWGFHPKRPFPSRCFDPSGLPLDFVVLVITLDDENPTRSCHAGSCP